MKQFIILFSFFLSNSLYAQNENNFSFIALGDVPYNIPKDYQKFEKLIDTINTINHQFNFFLGDFKSSKTPCEDSLYYTIQNYFNQFEEPLIYTPGDNEWTDCKTHNPVERLNFIRNTFYSKTNINFPFEQQSKYTNYSIYPENIMWNYNSIQFSTIHIVGTNNNLNEKSTDNKEYSERNKANLFWLKKTFEEAIVNKSKGIVIATHADMFTPDKGASGFTEFLEVLLELSENYKKPILLINGDSHKYLIDKPLKTVDYKTVLNFTRMQVYGETDINAIQINVNFNTPQLFEFQEIITK